jgi:hypothetical protein
MDSSKILSLLEQLDDEVEDLEEALAPLLKTPLSETSSKLPLLDKAKLYVLITYAIESVLFCKFHSRLIRIFLIYMQHICDLMASMRASILCLLSSPE